MTVALILACWLVIPGAIVAGMGTLLKRGRDRLHERHDEHPDPAGLGVRNPIHNGGV
jgi:hypothetical protein